MAVLAETVCPAGHANPETGSLCIAPRPELPKGSPGKVVIRGLLFCMTGNYSLKIDSEALRPWPLDKSARIDGLDLKIKHRVIVYCGGKAQQSFSFSFSQFKTTELCLFINDLYGTVQLWDKKDSPWCKCK